MRVRFLFATAAILSVASAQANLLTNGGFESSNVNLVTLGGNGGYQSFNAGSPDITGWTVGGNVDIVSNPGSWASGVHSGAYGLDLNGSPGPGAISQSFNSSTSTFLVSFWAMSNEGGQGVTLKVNGGTVLTLLTGTPPPSGIDGAYYNYTAVVNGNVGVNTLSFEIAPGSFGNTYLDDISVTSVPAPAAALPMALGFLARLRRRREA